MSSNMWNAALVQSSADSIIGMSKDGVISPPTMPWSRRMMEDVSLTGPPAVMGFRPCGLRNPGPRFETGQY
jgi:hypothetical protein